MDNHTINVEVICPAVSRKYDFVLRCSMTSGEAALRIAEHIKSAEHIEFLFSDEKIPQLFEQKYRLPLNPDITLEEYGIKSGSTIMII